MERTAAGRCWNTFLSNSQMNAASFGSSLASGRGSSVRAICATASVGAWARCSTASARSASWCNKRMTQMTGSPRRWWSNAARSSATRECAKPQEMMCSTREGSDLSTHTMHDVSTVRKSSFARMRACWSRTRLPPTNT